MGMPTAFSNAGRPFVFLVVEKDSGTVLFIGGSSIPKARGGCGAEAALSSPVGNGYRGSRRSPVSWEEQD